MDDEILDAEGSKRVANRAISSAALALFGAVGARILPGLYLPIPFYVIALIVGISATLTLNHPEARLIGGIRHVGIVIAVVGVVVAVLSLIGTGLLIYRTHA
jgi:hypothetical protein